jgi:hypothetical protein
LLNQAWNISAAPSHKSRAGANRLAIFFMLGCKKSIKILTALGKHVERFHPAKCRAKEDMGLLRCTVPFPRRAEGEIWATPMGNARAPF